MKARDWLLRILGVLAFCGLIAAARDVETKFSAIAQEVVRIESNYRDWKVQRLVGAGPYDRGAEILYYLDPTTGALGKLTLEVGLSASDLEFSFYFRGDEIIAYVATKRSYKADSDGERDFKNPSPELVVAICMIENGSLSVLATKNVAEVNMAAVVRSVDAGPILRVAEKLVSYRNREMVSGEVGLTSRDEVDTLMSVVDEENVHALAR